MKKSAFWLLIPMLFASFGCLKEDSIKEESAMHSLDATFEEINPETRVGFDLDNNAKFFWTKGDAIAIGMGDPLYKFTTDDATGSSSATFIGNVSPIGYAVYPWNAAKEIENGVLTYEFKKEYDYKTIDRDFFSCISVDVPMWAKVKNEGLSFKHLGGVIAFRFPEIPAGNDQVFTLTANKKISGTFETDLSVSEPIFKAEDTDDVSEKTVTIRFSLDKKRPAVFYVPAPVGEYDFTASLKSGKDEPDWTGTYSGLKVNRRSIRYTTVTTYTIAGGEAAEDDSNVKDVMESNTNVELWSVNGTSVSIKIPKKAADTDKEHTLTISKIDENTKKLEIKEETGAESGESSIEKLTVKIPSNYLTSLTVNMPETTVTLLPNGNNVTLNEVSATTADNTLIVGKNLTIKKLIVNKGNIRLQSGATVKAIERGDANTNKVIVIYEGTKPEISVDEDEVEFRSAAYEVFMAGMKQSGTVTLTEDLTINEKIIIPYGVTVKLDLNGKTLSQVKEFSKDYQSMIENNGNLTITGNGKISLKDTSAGDPNYGWGSYTIRNNGTLIVENGTIENIGEQSAHMMCAIFQYSGESVINGGTISTPNYRSARLWHGTMIINGGNFEGQLWLQATKENASHLVINGGTFAPRGGDGSSVFITNDTYKANCTITGGTFTTKVGTSNPNRDGVVGCITGGTFTQSAKDYTSSALIATGYGYVATGDGNYTVQPNN